MFKEAIGETAKSADALRQSGSGQASIGEDFTTSGYPGVMKSWLEGLKEVSKRGYVSFLQHGADLRPPGDKSQALASLETALEQRDSKSHVCEGRTRLRRSSLGPTIQEGGTAVKHTAVKWKANPSG